MIKIDFNEPTTSDWKRWRVRCASEQVRHNAAIKAGKKNKPNSLSTKDKKNKFISIKMALLRVNVFIVSAEFI